MNSVSLNLRLPLFDDAESAEEPAKGDPPVELDPAEEEELLRNYRRLPAGDRRHLRRCAEALAFLVEKETDAG